VSGLGGMEPEIAVVDFLNTVGVGDHDDVLDTSAGYHAWLAEHGLARRGDPEAARAVRTALRTAVGGESPASLGDVVRGVRLQVTFSADGIPVLTSPDPLGHILAAALALAGQGRWERVRLCPAEDCGRVFYDRSKNRSRQWCSMSLCGNRTKSRTFRARHRAASTAMRSGT